MSLDQVLGGMMGRLLALERALERLATKPAPLATPPRMRVYHAVDQSIADSTVTVLALNSERWDTGSMHSTTVNNSRATCLVPGNYAISASVTFAANATGWRQAYLVVNGAAAISMTVVPAANGIATSLTLATEYVLAAGQYVEIFVAQNSGGALNVLALPNYSPELSLTWIGG